MGTVEEFLNTIREQAEDLFDKDEEKEAFIEHVMTRKGYRKVSSWAEPEQGEQKSGLSFLNTGTGGRNSEYRR